jgi:hypothetical protein
MIKKISILAAIALFVTTSAFAGTNAGPATGATLLVTDGGKSLWGAAASAGPTTTLIGKNSTGVSVGAYSTALGYGITCQHINGTKAYGTSQDSTALYSFDVTATKGAFKLLPAATGSGQFSTWVSM